MPKPEAQLLSQIKHYLQINGFYILRINTGLITNEKGRFYRSAPSGTPDVICCILGRFIGIEAKSPKGKQSDFQKQHEELIKNNQGEYWLIRSIEELMEKVRVFKKSLTV